MMFSTIGRDLRFAIRRFAKRPGFTAIAVLSIGVGIGANTAIFSLVNAVMLRKLPLERPAELMDIFKAQEGFTHGPVSFPDLRDLERETGDVFAGVAGSRFAFAQEDVAGGVETLMAEVVSGNYFPLLGVPALHGRMLLPSDDVSPGGHPVIVLSYGFWQRRFGGDPAAVGQSLHLNGQSFTIVGVAPEAFTGSVRGWNSAVYGPRMMVGQLQPQDYDELETRGNNGVFVKARLRPGVSAAQAAGAIDRMTRALRERYPGDWPPTSALVMVPTASVIMNPMIDRVLVPATALIMTVVGLVLLIACANLASFLLAQAADRRREIAVRLALGAKRSTLVRQLLTEAIALAAAGGLLGVLLARLGLGALQGADLPLPIPIELDLSLDPRVLLFGLGLTVVAGVALGLAPGLQATRPDIAPTLKDESTGGGRPTGFGLRSALVVVQVAVSLLLLVGAGMFLRSLRARLDIDPGFGSQPAAIVTFQELPSRRTADEIRNFYLALREQANALPGVASAGYTTDLNLSPLNSSRASVTVAGVDPPPGRDAHSIARATVDGHFFEAAGIPIVEGRAFTEVDGADGAPAVVVNQTFARRFWPGQTAAGRTIRVYDQEHTVVGVARDAKVDNLGEDPTPFLYLAYAQHPTSGLTLVASTGGDAEATLREAVALARRLDPEVVVIEAKTMDRHLAAMLLPHRLGAWVVTAFGVLALLLASIGLFGVVSYAVSARSREVGIRMALGAAPGAVVRLLMRSGMRLVAIGTVVGLALALAAGRVMSGLLYGVGSMDVVTLVVAPLVLVGVAALAAWLPARRASGVSVVRAVGGR